MEGGSGFLNDHGSEHAVHLMRVGKQVIVEKHGPQFCVREETLDQCFVLSRASDVVPAVRSAVGNDGVKLHQMHMMSHDVCQRLHLEGTFFQVLGEQVGKAELNTVPGVGSDDKGLCLDLLILHFLYIAVQSAVVLQVFLQDEEPALGIMPAVAVISHFCLDDSDLKYFNVCLVFAFGAGTKIVIFRTETGISARMTGTGFGVESPGSKVFYKVCTLQSSWYDFIAAVRIQYAKRRLERSFAKNSVDKTGIPRMFFIFWQRRDTVF